MSRQAAGWAAAGGHHRPGRAGPGARRRRPAAPGRTWTGRCGGGRSATAGPGAGPGRPPLAQLEAFLYWPSLPGDPDQDGQGHRSAGGCLAVVERQVIGVGQAAAANLLACLDYATRTGQHARVVALTAALAALLQHDGPWTDAITRNTTAVHAARHLGDRPGEASALNDLGAVRLLTGDYPGAAGALETALGIYRNLGVRGSEAAALNEVGTLHRARGDANRAGACHGPGITNCLGSAGYPVVA